MKRLFIIIVSVFAASAMHGQVRCSTDYPDLELKYKRTTVSGSNVYVDFTLTYHGKDEMGIRISDGNNTIFYDDEGNIYKGQGLSGMGERKNNNIIADVGNANSDYGLLPSGIPIKLRMLIKNVDEYATSFPKIIIGFSSYGWYEMQISNVPIPRE